MFNVCLQVVKLFCAEVFSYNKIVVAVDAVKKRFVNIFSYVKRVINIPADSFFTSLLYLFFRLLFLNFLRLFSTGQKVFNVLRNASVAIENK